MNFRYKKSMLLGAAVTAALPLSLRAEERNDERPNIILILADDMGYSDIGCYGGEIPTPHIDRLAEQGVRYTQFYNTGRSCPTRASLLTGLYQHQAGLGAMTEVPFDSTRTDRAIEHRGKPGYTGFLNRNCVTMAEVLKEAGYQTYMAGKWHLGMLGQEKWPLQRGFDRFYGILSGVSSYLRPSGESGLTLDNTPLPPPGVPYYLTEAITDYAIRFIGERKGGEPFFLYLAYTAPHWPLQAKEEDMRLFRGKYDSGWHNIRRERWERMIRLGLVREEWGLAEWESRQWEDLTAGEQEESARKMETYAAQIHCMDRNIGLLLDYLTENGLLDNTLIVFLSDNGACAEPYNESGFGTSADINDAAQTRDPSYGLPWAVVSNTPYRKYKARAYEGGVCTPMILSWPSEYGGYAREIRENTAFLPDLMATFIGASGATYPEIYHYGQPIHPLAGKSLLPTLDDPALEQHEYIFGEHFNHCYVRHGRWKAVIREGETAWELYDLETDRTERFDISKKHPRLLEDLCARWIDWAHTHQVFPKYVK